MVDAGLIRGAVADLQVAYQEKGSPLLFAGPDGFLDEIIHVVDRRYDAERFDPIRTITEYAKRLGEAAGKSTNVEFVVNQVKSGGNGPLMSEAFGRLGGRLIYVGCVGWPEVDPLFKHLEEWGEIHTIAPAAITLATEFEDGKIMHGKHQVLKEVTWENLLNGLGGVEKLDAHLRAADVLALLNWTMLPYLNDVLKGVLDRVASMGPDCPQTMFFDLCDPEKRPDEDLMEALSVMASFSRYAKTVILGLNEKESLEVCEAYGLAPGEPELDGLQKRAEAIARKTGVTEVVIHPTRAAAAWNTDGHTGLIVGPYCPKPKLTTGAGDHFNGGYVFARSMGLPPAKAVVIGKCVSGFYVREGRGPSVEELSIMADRWAGESLDPWAGV